MSFRPSRPGTTVLWLALGSVSVAVAATAVWTSGLGRESRPYSPDPGFRPELASLELLPRRVRPGEDLAYLARFRNAGERAAAGSYEVFVHFEPVGEEPDCGGLAFQDDHLPVLPTDRWEPGATVADGPRTLRVPPGTPEGDLEVHLGVFAEDLGDWRLLDLRAGLVSIDRHAGTDADWIPEPLPEEELGRRRAALRDRLVDPVALEGDGFAFALDRASGAFLLTDERGDVAWSSDPARSSFGRVVLRREGETATLFAERFDDVRREDGRLVARARLADGRSSARAELTIVARLLEGGSDGPGPGVELSHRCRPAGDWEVEAVHLVDRGLFTCDADGGYLVLPRNMGRSVDADFVPARREVSQLVDGGSPVESYETWVDSSRPFGTYDQISMAMCGVVRRGSALLAAWSSVDVELQVHTALENRPLVPGRRVRSVSIVFPSPEGAIELYPLGPGDHVEVGRAYRAIAERRGMRVTLAEKRRRNAAAELVTGAAHFKPCLLHPMMPDTPHNPGDEPVTALRFTFDEVARCAEHWRNELELDRAMIVLAGWNHGGYDNELPKVLPAPEAIGGNAGLADCARRVRACGYLFGLHENYHDMFRDSPLWDESRLHLGAQGLPLKGGVWSGGRSRVVCASQQSALAEPNLRRLAELCEPDLHFFDATLANPLRACTSDEHPATREDTLEHNRELFRIANRIAGLTGVEGFCERAVPEVLYFEGLLSTLSVESTGRPELPLFSIVFGDCAKAFSRQDFTERVWLDSAERILDCVLHAEMPLYHLADHAYFDGPLPEVLPIELERVECEPRGESRLALLYHWRALGSIDRDRKVFVHLTRAGGTEGGEAPIAVDDHWPEPPTSSWQPGELVVVGPREIELPEPLGDGELEIRAGMLGAGDERLLLAGREQESGRHLVGRLRVEDGVPRFEPAAPARGVRTFARADDGWAEHLGSLDRLLKSTWEVLTWLDRLTADRPMTDHAFLRPDRTLQRSAFGDVEITVNYGDEPALVGDAVLPLHGFLVSSPTYVAFHATRYASVDYPGGALFTLRSLDERPLADSGRIRVFHGFGKPVVEVGGSPVEVRREAIVSAR